MMQPAVWFVLGGALMVAEAFLPGVFLLWFGVAALGTGLVGLVAWFGWPQQAAVFALLAVIAVLAGLPLRRRPEPAAPAGEGLNRRAALLIGDTVIAEGPIVAGRGRVKVGDGSWSCTGPDCPTGTHLQVIGSDGAILRVERR